MRFVLDGSRPGFRRDGTLPERDIEEETRDIPTPEVAELFNEPGPKRGRKAPFRPTSKQPV